MHCACKPSAHFVAACLPDDLPSRLWVAHGAPRLIRTSIEVFMHVFIHGQVFAYLGKGTCEEDVKGGEAGYHRQSGLWLQCPVDVVMLPDPAPFSLQFGRCSAKMERPGASVKLRPPLLPPLHLCENLSYYERGTLLQQRQMSLEPSEAFPALPWHFSEETHTHATLQ
eukprot:1158368-Pelagomonas_calceolata.AAC.2